MIDDTPARAVRLLDVDADLGADFDPDAFAEARDQIVVPAITLGPGIWTPAEIAAHSSVRGRLLGAIIMSGLSVRDVILAGRVSTHLHGPGDLIADDETHSGALPVTFAYSVPVQVEIALLDDRFLVASRRWPRLSGRLLDLASQQIRRASTHQAISQLPRVEDRLVALFWHLADRWGHVGPDGILIRLPLTHKALGRLIGARRPTVSLGLRVLADSGALTRNDEGDWCLDASTLDTLGGADAVRGGVLSLRPAPPATPPVPRQRDRAALLERVAGLRAGHEQRQAETADILARNHATCEHVRLLRARLPSRAAA